MSIVLQVWVWFYDAVETFIFTIVDSLLWQIFHIYVRMWIHANQSFHLFRFGCSSSSFYSLSVSESLSWLSSSESSISKNCVHRGQCGSFLSQLAENLLGSSCLVWFKNVSTSSAFSLLVSDSSRRSCPPSVHLSTCKCCARKVSPQVGHLECTFCHQAGHNCMIDGNFFSEWSSWVSVRSDAISLDSLKFNKK